jgi:hypothetical protein
VLIYLGFSAIATFLAALVLLRFGEASPAAVTHLVFVIGIMPLIVGAITHFVPVLTRSGRAPRSLLLAPLGLQLAGWLAFLDFRGEMPAAVTAAIGALVITVFLGGWLVLRARRTLGRPHPGWRWYLAAVVFLAMALILVPAMNWWPQARPELRLLHLHLNTLGFVGLTALGTLQVLLPTVLGGPDADAAKRLQHDLPYAIGGVLMAGFGAAFWLPLALAGCGPPGLCRVQDPCLLAAALWSEGACVRWGYGAAGRGTVRLPAAPCPGYGPWSGNSRWPRRGAGVCRRLSLGNGHRRPDAATTRLVTPRQTYASP